MDKVQDRHLNAKLLAVAISFALFVGFSFFGIKKCALYATPLEILAYRYMAALIGVIVWLLVTRLVNGPVEKPEGRPKLKLYQTAAFYILFMIFQIVAMFFATSIEGAIVYAMVPIFAKLIGRVVLGEKSTLMQYVFMGVTVSALVILVILNATSISLNPVGIILMTISSIFMACNNVSARYIRGVFKPIEITTCIAVGGFPVFVSAALINAGMKGNVLDFFEPLKHAEFVIWAAFLGVFCILLSAQFAAFMLAHLQIIQMTAANSASTLISIIAGAIILGEPLYWFHYVCGILIMIGVIGLALAPANKENDGRALGDKIQ